MVIEALSKGAQVARKIKSGARRTLGPFGILDMLN